jgi:hypothetical protein
MAAFEDRNVIAVCVADMPAAIKLINLTKSADLLRQIVPGKKGYWLVYKADSSIKQGLEEVHPNLEVVSGWEF